MSEVFSDSLELLCPAGDLNRLYAAVDYGADAVYLAGKEFGMRTAASNFTNDDLVAGIKYAHDNGVPVYVTCNTVPHNDEIERLPQFISFCTEAGADAFIVSDLGAVSLIKRYSKNAEIHISVQAGIVNYETARFFSDMGADRIVLARELCLDEIAKIRQKTPKSLKIEAFVHGAMCVSYSGRCLLSSYLTGRDANRGDCAQPCRWSYALMEEKRPGQYYEISETDKGSYILNANDLCMVECIDKLAAAGVDSLKIEGRAKSHYYTAVTTNAYRGALDEYYKSPAHYKAPQWVLEELNKISHRHYSTGFYFGKPQNEQTYSHAGYERDYSVAAVVEGYQDGMILARLKNKFSVGQELDCLEPKSSPTIFTVSKMFDGEGTAIEVAPHPMSLIKIPFERPLKNGALLRMKNKD